MFFLQSTNRPSYNVCFSKYYLALSNCPSLRFFVFNVSESALVFFCVFSDNPMISKFLIQAGWGVYWSPMFFFKWSNLFCSAIWRTIYWKSSNQHSQSINLLMLNTLICCRASWCQFNWTIITLSFYYIYMPRSTVILCKLNCKLNRNFVQTKL